MRLALLLRQRRRLLMPFGAIKNYATADSQPQLRVGVKRSYAQQATAAVDVSSSKVPRFGGGSPKNPFSSSRRVVDSPKPKPQSQFIPQFKILDSSQDNGSSSGFTRVDPFGVRQVKSGRLKKKLALQSKRGPGTSTQKAKTKATLLRLHGEYHTQEFIAKKYNTSPIRVKEIHEREPKSAIGTFCAVAYNGSPRYSTVSGHVYDGHQHHLVYRTTLTIDIEPAVIGVGDHPSKKDSERLAALSAVYQLHQQGVLDNARSLNFANKEEDVIKLSDGSLVKFERAKAFVDYYCRRYNFGKPEITYNEIKGTISKWEAVMNIGGNRIGFGIGGTKKIATNASYLDVTQYLEGWDKDLWNTYMEASKTGADLGPAPNVILNMSNSLNDQIRDLCDDIKRSHLYKNRPVAASSRSATHTIGGVQYNRRTGATQASLSHKSKRLLARRKEYLFDPKLERMRTTRASLPVSTCVEQIMQHIDENDVTICMAATGSGKTTQIPQMILDGFIEREEGAKCNVVCTQPRRLAAMSVADRVAKERGESLGSSVGYQVRFESRLPEDHGSITFCTTGVFLKRLQSALLETGHDHRALDDVTHIVVDEVHERDVDTDLLLVVLKRLKADRKARNKPLKIILMSATIDPTLFQKYFPDDAGEPAKVIQVPGRSFPVVKYFMDDFVPSLLQGRYNWIATQESVISYVTKELGYEGTARLGIRPNPSVSESRYEDLELPYPLIAATISHVLQSSDDGHVLVFLPGWEEIIATQKALTKPIGPLGLNFEDNSKYSIHLLHSTIPLAEQQVVFEPPPPGVRRIILATNIAETSVTIPDIVYVVDSARVKEQRYDPNRHMSSLVSAWVGTSNLNQRAGRAGRHRSGEYFGIIGRQHTENLDPYQTVEMKRVDLSNVVMHVKALNFPGISVEEVLAAAIEPPESERVTAAQKNLQLVGALDAEGDLTSLGRVLLQLPIDAQMGRLVLYGSFFRCLDQSLTLAALLTSRDPFVSPLTMKAEAAAKKISWSPPEFTSDVLASLRAFNAWWAIQSRNEYTAANRFCNENFLSKTTLLMIQKIKSHLLQALYRAGVIDISAGGMATPSDRVPAELNANGDSLPLLVALVAIASQPKFAIRVSDVGLRTARDKMTFMHPSSVNFRRRKPLGIEGLVEKQIFAFVDKRCNTTTDSAQTFLMTTTRLQDPTSYVLLGAHTAETTPRGVLCDGWIPIVSRKPEALEDLLRLKSYIDACMIRVFEGITMGKRLRKNQRFAILPREDEEFEDEDQRDLTLSQEEVKELDFLTRDVVSIMNKSGEERLGSLSRSSTPLSFSSSTHTQLSTRFPGRSSPFSLTVGRSTPVITQSKPSTPSWLRRPF